ncbi:hypothetical protein GobsT_16090 [Gemmata obscuriglobus]|uniref:Uncharacterized protein n=1 Tax=Gemmata obscuriglobus TaxID=114 RepID=A0A2Z3HF85_9BACT|nr:hypothetical protein [Gemmata obscuriglobus]AWM39990.1 hypothetical protein C1280_25280 [Gemmata obscuriglobus]QEG26861.1 hypothetical protein GobsT_16090 [Gemmata obscuriglobus]VTS02874.1 Uncharacterized protein OS=Planctomyces brasiliensis (strain ATCC 49424 / DSM 5305 / JCM 21570 / NBRC 103401 / IFAM 1448) GN=Plabr_1608 PE=4 SV=1 [Gemmata obscuriglobus UQM 2246]
MRIGFGGRGLAAAALVCHLLTTFGFPLPTPRKKGDGTPYPCQTRPCGCLTSDECWKGDCCCFTLEEKLLWAEENGVEPPAHVRPLVESRQSQPAAPKKKKACCSEPEPAPAPSCCSKLKAAPACYAEKAPCEAEAARDCASCPTKSAAVNRGPKPCHETPAPDRSGVRWVVGVYAQKCRGQGPAGLFLHDPSFVPDTPTVFADPPEPDRFPAPLSDRAVAVPHVPPTPPPRAS